MSVEDSYENRNTLSTSHPSEEICFLEKQMWNSEGWDLSGEKIPWVVEAAFVMKGEVWGSRLGGRRVEARCGTPANLCQSHFASGWPEKGTTENCSDANK